MYSCPWSAKWKRPPDVQKTLSTSILLELVLNSLPWPIRNWGRSTLLGKQWNSCSVLLPCWHQHRQVAKSYLAREQPGLCGCDASSRSYGLLPLQTEARKNFSPGNTTAAPMGLLGSVSPQTVLQMQAAHSWSRLPENRTRIQCNCQVLALLLTHLSLEIPAAIPPFDSECLHPISSPSSSNLCVGWAWPAQIYPVLVPIAAHGGQCTSVCWPIFPESGTKVLYGTFCTLLNVRDLYWPKQILRIRS